MKIKQVMIPLKTRMIIKVIMKQEKVKLASQLIVLKKMKNGRELFSSFLGCPGFLLYNQHYP